MDNQYGIGDDTWDDTGYYPLRDIQVLSWHVSLMRALDASLFSHRTSESLKINWIKGLAISVVFNNGESRIIDFYKVLKSIGIEDNSPASILFNENDRSDIELATLRKIIETGLGKQLEILISACL